MGFFDFLGGGDDRNPADAAMPYLNKIAPMEKQYFDPFIQRGNTAYGKMAPQFDQMSKDPAAFLEMILGKYQPSKAYGLKRDEMMRAAGNTAAAGGMRGSGQDMVSEERIADTLLGEDMQQWLQNVLGIHGRGLEGESKLYDTGFDAAKSLTGDLSNTLGTQATLGFQGQAERNKSQSDIIGAIAKALGAGAGAYYGGIPGMKAASSFF
jgi:hypothetical protein